MPLFSITNEATNDVMLERTAIRLICEREDGTLITQLQPEDFSDLTIREIFSAALAVHQESKFCTFPLLSNKLRALNWYIEQRGPALLGSIMTWGPPETYDVAPEHHVFEAMRELRIRRYASEFNKPVGEAREIIAKYTEQVQKLQNVMPRSQKSTLEILDTLPEDEPDWISSGFNSMDRLVHMRYGNLISIGARTGHGKTVILGNIACNHAKAGHKALFLTKEMTADELVQRFVTYLTQQPYDLARKNVDRETLSRVIVHQIKTVEDVERYAVLTDADLVLVDYIQLLELSGKRPENRVTELERITNRLKGIAMETGKCFVAASQISRETDRTVREPVLADLKGSGSIEQDSNVVILVHNPALAPDDQENQSSGRSINVSKVARSFEGRDGMVTFIVAKNRSGKTGRFDLRWNPETISFIDPLNTKPSSSLPF
jgi:replicative DNA helicase